MMRFSFQATYNGVDAVLQNLWVRNQCKQKTFVFKSYKNCWYNLSTPHSHFSRKDFVPCQSMLIEEIVRGKPR